MEIIQPTRDFVPVEKFGKDHWNTLMYIETRCTDHGGILSNAHMRCNVNTHYDLIENWLRSSIWDEKHGTRLNDGTVLPTHDDWDCLEDLIHAGYIQPRSVLTSKLALTSHGEVFAYALRSHKAHGGNLSDFKVIGPCATVDDEIIEMIIAVSYHGLAYVVSAPVEDMKLADGSVCEDNNFISYPKTPGVYRCEVEHRFVVTVNEGVEECEESFRVLRAIPLVLIEARKDK